MSHGAALVLSRIFRSLRSCGAGLCCRCFSRESRCSTGEMGDSSTFDSEVSVAISKIWKTRWIGSLAERITCVMNSPSVYTRVEYLVSAGMQMRRKDGGGSGGVPARGSGAIKI